MLSYLVGLLAALLWAGTIIGLFIIFRSSPRHPFKTIKEFRLARRRLSKPAAPLVEVVNEADLAEPVVFVDQPEAPDPGSLDPQEEEFEDEVWEEEGEALDELDQDEEFDEDEDEYELEEEEEDEELDEDEDEDEELDEDAGEDEELDEDAGELVEEEYEEDEAEQVESESVSPLDIILVDDFGKPAK